MNADALPSDAHVMPTYGRLPVALSHGQGCWVWDTQGRRLLDGLAGIAVNTLGHNHPRLVAALQEQVGKLIHTSNYYHVPLQEQLAAKLCELSGLANVFFCNSGLEANEAALKIARKFGHDRGNTSPEVLGVRRRLPRPLDRDAVGYCQSQDPGRLRAAGAGLRAGEAQ